MELVLIPAKIIRPAVAILTQVALTPITALAPVVALAMEVAQALALAMEKPRATAKEVVLTLVMELHRILIAVLPQVLGPLKALHLQVVPIAGVQQIQVLEAQIQVQPIQVAEVQLQIIVEQAPAILRVLQVARHLAL